MADGLRGRQNVDRIAAIRRVYEHDSSFGLLLHRVLCDNFESAVNFFLPFSRYSCDGTSTSPFVARELFARRAKSSAVALDLLVGQVMAMAPCFAQKNRATARKYGRFMDRQRFASHTQALWSRAA